MLNLAIVLENSAREFPGKTAVIFGKKRLAYEQINAMANQVANGLTEEGIGKGDKVALSCPNLPFFPIIYYGILKTGAVVVPLNILLKSREIAYHLKDSEANAYFCFQGSPELPLAENGWAAFKEIDSCKNFWIVTEDPTDPSPIDGAKTFGQLITGQSSLFDTATTRFDDTAIILYTSGTTGLPKGAELSHANMTMNAMVGGDAQQLQTNDVQAVVLPLFHAFGQTLQMNAGLLKGNTLVIIPKFTPEAVLSAMQTEKITVFSGVPTMYWALLNYENKDGLFDLEGIGNTLRVGVSGGSPLPLEVIRGFEKKYKIPIIEGYGLSETCPAVSLNPLTKQRKPGSIGTPLWGVDVQIFNENEKAVGVGEVGEIVVRGHNIMKGYLNKPAATAEALKGGWFHTGDLGRKDEEGYIYIVDRVKDMIIRGGYNVYPREIEEVLMAHPAVSLVSVIGVPHDRYGEEIKAYVVLKEDKSITEDELLGWGKEQMASYKYPRIIEFRDALPITATGKILKKELKAEVYGR